MYMKNAWQPGNGGGSVWVLLVFLRVIIMPAGFWLIIKEADEVLGFMMVVLWLMLLMLCRKSCRYLIRLMR